MKVKNGILNSATWLPSPNYGQRPAQCEIALVVIHNISLPPGEYGTGQIQRFFCNQLDSNAHPYFSEIASMQVSSHLLIERNGDVVQFVNFNDRAWHAGVSCYQGQENCNDFSIGIELEGTDEDAYTTQQYEILANVISELRLVYPAIRQNITGHEHIAPGRKTDPGPAFDWDYFWQQLDGLQGDE